MGELACPAAALSEPLAGAAKIDMKACRSSAKSTVPRRIVTKLCKPIVNVLPLPDDRLSNMFLSYP
jgi:hypothetical protein